LTKSNFNQGSNIECSFFRSRTQYGVVKVAFNYDKIAKISVCVCLCECERNQISRSVRWWKSILVKIGHFSSPLLRHVSTNCLTDERVCQIFRKFSSLFLKKGNKNLKFQFSNNDNDIQSLSNKNPLISIFQYKVHSFSPLRKSLKI
jgi:hypothetical protein